MKIKPILLSVALLPLIGAGCLSRPSPEPTPAPEVPPVMEPDESSDEIESPPTTSAMWAEPNGVVVTNQRPGREVLVSALILEQDGWVVIHREENNNPGKIIGSYAVRAGEANQLSVSLDEATEDGSGYYAMLHVDNGDAQFNPAEDIPVQSMLGGPVVARFMADADAGDVPAVMP